MAYSQQNKAWCQNQRWKTAKWEELAYTFGDGTLVRYVENPPLADMEGITEFLLHADSCASTALKVNEKLVHGAYRPVAAWFETVTVRGEERLRLYHECVPAASTGAGTAYVAENGCWWTVTLTPYFRQAAVAVPAAGTSGVSYRIVGERADPRTGLWMFTLEKREQKTTTTGVVTARDDAFATVTEQTFYGVRTGNTDHTGAAIAAMWTAGNPSAGTLIENVSVRKNDNCTIDIVQRKTVAKTGVNGAGVSSGKMKTIQGLVTVEDSNTDAKTAPEAEEQTQTPGIAVTVRNKNRADGLVDVQKIIETGEKYTDTYEIPDEDGQIFVTRYFNHTAEEEQALLTALSASRSNQASPGDVNKFRKFDGVIVSRPPRRGSNAHNRDAVDKTGLTYTRVDLVYRDGVEYARTWTYTYSVKQDWGVDSGYAAYTGAKNGSNFSLLGDDWYKFEKVTDIKVSETPVTLTASPQSI